MKNRKRDRGFLAGGGNEIMQHSFPGSPGKTAFVSSSFPIRFQKDRSFPKNTPIGAYMETRLPKPMKDSPLKRAIESLPIPVLWQRLGLPGHVTANCCVRSPLRDDRSPSFSIFVEPATRTQHRRTRPSLPGSHR